MCPSKRPRSFVPYSYSPHPIPAFFSQTSVRLHYLKSSSPRSTICPFRPCRFHASITLNLSRQQQYPNNQKHINFTSTTSSIPDSSIVPNSTKEPSAEISNNSTESFDSTTYEGYNNQADESDTDASARQRPKRIVSIETRRKIATTMLGRPKSEDMRAKVSQKLKGRIPWNKGKKLSPETRARMSQARLGRPAWNKGISLSSDHRKAISRAASNACRIISDETRRRMRMAHRRPGDAIVGDSSRTGRQSIGSYPLVETADINSFVTLRRELRVWSDRYVDQNGKRPSIADIRRIAPVAIMRKFEKYVIMRNQIRGLASDVYGSVDPEQLPIISGQTLSNGPVNNNSRATIHVTKHGNRRLVFQQNQDSGNVGYNEGKTRLEGAIDDMWDKYDRPNIARSNSKMSEVDHSLIGVHEIPSEKNQHLSANDYRKIGRYRLMETMDINRYVTLRKELETWSQSFRETNGRTPALSDAHASGKPYLYAKFCEYLNMRDKMNGLVQEVYGTGVDDVEAFKTINHEGKVILQTLRNGNMLGDHDHDHEETNDIS